jgi:hypothetical protein
MRPSRIGTIAILIAIAFAARPPARAQQIKSTWGQILIAGGPYDGGVDLYDPASNRFAPELATPRMKSRVRATATLLVTGPNAGKVLLAGGDNRNDVPRASTELYDPLTNTVVDGPAMKTPRSGHTATAIPCGPNSGKILFAGGMGAFSGALSSTELYDPATGKFSAGPAMHAACALCTATVIRSGKNAGKILIAGGIEKDTDKNGSGIFRKLYSTELYDPATNTFAPGPRMNSDRFDAVAVQLPPAARTPRRIIEPPSRRSGSGVPRLRSG